MSINNIIVLLVYKMLSGIKGNINIHSIIHYSVMYTSSHTLYASSGSKCAPSCFHSYGLVYR